MMWFFCKKMWIGCFLCAFLSGCGQYYVKIQPSSHRNWTQSHRVQKEENVYSIARQYQVAPNALINKNKLKPPYTLSIGQLIFIPPTQIHTVQKGETLYNISRTYGVDINSLAKTNNIKRPYSLALGQKLVMPGIVFDREEKKSSLMLKSSAKYAQTSKEKNLFNSSKKADSKILGKTSLHSPPQRIKKFAWPVKGKIISDFGVSNQGRHNDGINIASTKETFFKASENGVVAYAGNKLKGFGNLLLIKHTDGWVTAYAHADSLSVKRGDNVKKGQVIGKIGSTGNVKNPQLHFEIRQGTKALNPNDYLTK